MSQVNYSKRTDQNESTPSGYPDIGWHEEKIFITVKTYPRPSVKYRELVCTAGITENGKWIRLYPIDFRYMKYLQQYKKYQWTKVKVAKNQTDFRADSYRPEINSIHPLGAPFDTKKDKNWTRRKEILLPTVHYRSLEEIQDDYESKGISLGIFKPKKVEDLIIEADTADWSPKHSKVLNQLVLFGDQPKPLTKIPYKFSYKFICNDERCKKAHELAILDWEIFMLYLNIKNNYPYAMDEILQKIKDKWLTEMWSPKRDSYLIVGTQFPYPTFMVLGVFWPPK